MEKVDIAIIGAGIVGLALAHELSAQTNKTIVVVEKHASFGQETSSRNSQVIHSGINYPSNLLKTKLCIEGRQMLYRFCEKYRVEHKRLGKLIIAADNDDSDRLQSVLQQAKTNQVEVKLITAGQIHELEPSLQVSEAIWVPEAGIIDVHEMMRALFYLSRENCVIFAFHSQLTGLEYTGQDYILETNRDKFKADWVINSAGLSSDIVSHMLGIDIDKYGYRIFPCKGEYYSLKKSFIINHLIYPLPGKNGILGIHITPDMTGRLRLGPNAYDVSEFDYSVDDQHHEEFYLAVRRIWPGLERDDIAPDFAGIRPRLQRLSEPLQDFVITEESSKGFPQFINLIGIESPGMTSCLAIAAYVKGLIPPF